MARAPSGAEDYASICRFAELHSGETFSVVGRREFVGEELFMGLMWMAVRSGEDGSLVETRGWGCNGKSLRNHWGEN